MQTHTAAVRYLLSQGADPCGVNDLGLLPVESVCLTDAPAQWILWENAAEIRGLLLVSGVFSSSPLNDRSNWKGRES